MSFVGDHDEEVFFNIKSGDNFITFAFQTFGFFFRCLITPVLIFIREICRDHQFCNATDKMFCYLIDNALVKILRIKCFFLLLIRVGGDFLVLKFFSKLNNVVF